jgi:Fe-S oxidoreductase
MSRKRKQARDKRSPANDWLRRKVKPGGWACLRCGNPMDKKLAAATARELATPGVPLKLVEVCGNCGEWHGRDGDALRILSDAEKFDLRMKATKSADMVDKFNRDFFAELPANVRGIGVKQEFDQ